MCDELTEKDNEKYFLSGGKMNRRDFGALGAAAGLAAMLPSLANAMTITDSTVNVPMANGVSDCFFVHPVSGTHPAVLIWPDIKGLRSAFKVMARRLAESGYSVLVANPFYRDTKAPAVGPLASFQDPDTRAYLRGMAGKLTQTNVFSDAKDYVGFLDQQDSVDTDKKVGTTGYCMGGPLIMRTAAALPDRIGAAASFHGGGLVTDKDDSPHLLIPKTPAQILHAIAVNDDEKAPETKNVLAAAYKTAGIKAEIEVYEGAMHGWCPPDSRVYNEAQAEKAWGRMLALFERSLS